MKLHERSTQRFVKEYANWKISVLESLMKNYPEREIILTANIAIIKGIVKKWENGIVPTDEVMRKISEY